MDGSHQEGYEPRPLPPYRDPRAALKDALPALRPPSRMSVTAAAEKYMRVRVGGQWRDFDRKVTPYMLEPTDMITSREFRGLSFCGPSQSGKTQMLQSAIAYCIACDPGRTALFQMTRDAASEYSQEKISPMLRNSPELVARQSSGRSADNIFEKKFRGGMRLTLNWPTITQFSSATIRTVLETDYDHFPDSIDGEGDGYTLGRARTRTHGSRGMCAVEGSPAKPILKEDWQPSRIHEAPPVTAGVLSLYNQGTRARLYWTCPHCEEQFEPNFNQLKYDSSLQPAEAAEKVEMVCPRNGCFIEHSEKYSMNLASIWLHESRCGTRAVPIDDPDRRPSDMVSYWMNGVAAAFATWADLVQQFEAAKRHFVATNDEEKLKSITNTGLGEPYLARAMVVDGQLTVKALQNKQRVLEQSTAPTWTRFITVGVDVQKGRFVVQVLAWGISGERAVIDRFDLGTPPVNAPRAKDRVLAPQTYIEDWEVLRPLLTTVYPVDGHDFGLTPMAIGCDFHGEAGVSDNAEKFWHARRKDGEVSRWYLIRGHGGFKVPDRVWYKAPERAHAGKKARSIKLLNVATDKLKDSVFSALSREDAGPGSMHLGDWMAKEHLEEFTAESREPTGWKPRKGMKRNESIDLSVYGLAVAIFKGMERIDWDSPPEWAVGGASNTYAVLLASEDTGPAPAPKSPVKSASRISFLE